MKSPARWQGFGCGLVSFAEPGGHRGLGGLLPPPLPLEHGNWDHHQAHNKYVSDENTQNDGCAFHLHQLQLRAKMLVNGLGLQARPWFNRFR
ncbi:hypothetical protein EU642_22210 [Salmonella enterica]|nr:hypothetical protein [Salmonella enterica]EAR6391567.1 hypothetical protein [Salmonella enterica]EAV1285331.1 hypothetical protein [Salmonella enterica]